MGMGLAEGGDEGLRLGPALAEGGHEEGVAVLIGQAALGEGGQHPVGTELDVRRHARGFQDADAVEETDRLADVPHPELGRSHLVGDEAAGQVGDDRDTRGLERQPRHHLTEVLQHAVHVRRVERVAHGEALGLAVGEGLRKSDRGVLVTGDDHRPGTVDGRDAHPVRQQREDLLLRGLDRDHHATRRQCLHQATPGGYQRAGVIERQHPGDVRGGDLTDGVTGQEVRPYAPALHEPEQRHLDREQRRLGVLRTVQNCGIRPEQHLLQGQFEVSVHPGADRVERVREDRVGIVELTPHAEPLAPLPGEQERRAADGGRSVCHARRLLAGREGPQGGQELVPLPRDHDGAALQGGPGGGQRVGHIGGFEELVRGHGRQQALGLHSKGCLVLRGQHPRQDAAGPLLRLHGRLHVEDVRCLLDDGVGVGAAEAERGDAGPARTPGLGPVALLGQQLDLTRRPVDVRGGLVHVQGLRQHPVLHRQHHLDHARDTGGGLGVTDVGLDRPEQQGLLLGTLLAVGGEQCLRLDGVSEAGAGAVRLDGVDLGGRQSGAGEGGADHPLLRGPIGGRQAIARTVLVDRRAPHHGQNRVTVALRVRQPLDEQHADTLAPARTVRIGGERLDPAVLRQPALTAEVDVRTRRRHDGHATGESHVALAATQRLDRPVQSDQRSRASGVDGDRRTFETEGVGQPTGNDTRGVAGAEEALDPVGYGVERRVVVLAVGADEDTGLAAPQGGGVDPGAFEGLPGGLQEETLLGVHGQGLAGRDAEEVGVEVGGVVEEAAFAGVERALLIGVGVVEAVEVPASVDGELADGVSARRQQLPEVLRSADAAGEAAAHRDDRDGVVVHGRDRRGHRSGDSGLGSEQFVAEERRDGGSGRVVEDQRGRQAHTGRGPEPVAQLNRGQRVEAQLLEGPFGTHRLRTLVSEDSGHVGTDQAEQLPLQLDGSQTGEPVDRRTGAGCGTFSGGPGLGQLGEERAGACHGEGGPEPVPVHIRDQQSRIGGRDHALPQYGHRRVGRHGRQPLAPHPRVHRLIGGHTALGPRAPGERGRRQPGSTTLLGQGVQIGVRGRVVTLTGSAGHTAH
ncbi:hypothetical protein EES37_20780 [Streptomyces sp. ADI91-18]|nr:hypothetical protein EES37_20780 [Streptomyces sp. ADI91-18]